MSNHGLPSDAFQMISSSQIITPALFAEAIKDLPLDTVYAKAAELQNSISHLLDSNIQMKPFADQGDKVCEEAIAENDSVIRRAQERIELCKKEIENRGSPWSGHASGEELEANGHPDTVHGAMAARAPNGSLADEELRRQLEAQIDAEDSADGNNGVYL